MVKENIKAIIGLGNPGAKYKRTRHNIGFQVLDAMADKYNSLFREKDNFEIAKVSINSSEKEQTVLLIKPQTFMNNSGQIGLYLKHKNIAPHEILVIHDDLELDFGKLAFKLGGSAKGHNGLRSIIANIGADFWRLRVGISRPEDKSQVAIYVLQDFSKIEELKLADIINRAINLIIDKFYP